MFKLNYNTMTQVTSRYTYTLTNHLIDTVG